MTNRHLGGLKAAKTTKERHGDSFYKQIGAKGGAVKNVKKGFALWSREALQEHGRITGKIGRGTYKTRSNNVVDNIHKVNQYRGSEIHRGERKLRLPPTYLLNPKGTTMKTITINKLTPNGHFLEYKYANNNIYITDKNTNNKVILSREVLQAFMLDITCELVDKNLGKWR